MEVFTVTQKAERLDKYLSEKLDKSRSLISKMIDQGCILVNGEKPKASYKIKEKDKIEIVKEYYEEIDLTPEELPLDIVFEDENVLVINKPSGLVVHPGSGNFSHTLVNGLLYHTNLSEGSTTERPGIVHRIDKDTSGLMLVAKNNEAHQILTEDFKNKRVERKYIALVKGILKNNSIVIDAPIGRDEKNRKKMAVTATNSKRAVTHVKLLKRYEHYTLIECKLETGRTHQIRVHMAYIGYPLFNDPVYGTEKIKGFGQFLHSSEITFTEPITKEKLSFSCPLPKEFQEFLDELEKEEPKEEKENTKTEE